MLYQVIWKEDYDSDVKYPEGLSTNRDSNNKKGLKLFSLKKYDPATAKYTIVAEYSYKDIDGTGKGNPNGLSLDPEGRAYVTYSKDKDNKNVDLIQLLPGGKYPNASHEVIAKLREDTKGSDLTAGTYLEEDGVPYVIVSTGFGGGTSKKVNLKRYLKEINFLINYTGILYLQHRF